MHDKIDQKIIGFDTQQQIRGEKLGTCNKCEEEIVGFAGYMPGVTRKGWV